MYCKINKEKNLNKELKKFSLLCCIKMCKCLFIYTDWENQLGIQIKEWNLNIHDSVNIVFLETPYKPLVFTCIPRNVRTNETEISGSYKPKFYLYTLRHKNEWN